MYPSGEWRGYWDQPHWGRQPMRGLVLRFANGRIEGSGRDVVGRFTFTGTYDDRGNVILVKQYLKKHKVLYRGTYDGEGTIFGRWSIPPLSGTFALTPVHAPPVPDAPIEEIH